MPSKFGSGCPGISLVIALFSQTRNLAPLYRSISLRRPGVQMGTGDIIAKGNQLPIALGVGRGWERGS